MKYLKYAALFVVFVPIALLILLTSLLYSLDPNIFKPIIRDQLAEQNIDIRFNGDLSWSLYPVFRLQLGALALSRKTEPASLATLDSAALALEIKPLLKRKIKFSSLILDGVKLELIESSQGNNWQHIGRSGADIDKTDVATEFLPGGRTSNAESAAIVTVKRINVRNLSARYTNLISKQVHALDNLNLELQELNGLGEEMVVSLMTHITLDSMVPIKLFVSAEPLLFVDEGRVSFGATKITINPLSATDNALQLNLQGDLLWKDVIGFDGSLSVSEFNLQKFLKGVGAAELDFSEKVQKMQFSSKLAYGDNFVELKNAKLSLGDFSLLGNARVNLNPLFIKSQLKASVLRVTDFFPLTESSQKNTTANETSDALPLEEIRHVGVDINLSADAIHYDQYVFSSPQMSVSGEDGLFSLTSLKGGIYKGEVDAKGFFDARESVAKVSMNASLSNLDVGAAATSFFDNLSLVGSGDVRLQLDSRGRTADELIDTVYVSTETELPQLLLNGVNLSKQFCRALSFFDKGIVTPSEWLQATIFAPIKIDANYTEKMIALRSAKASIESLLAKVEGRFDIATGDFSFPIDLSASDVNDQLEGCVGIDEKWLSRSIPLICEGNINTIGVDVCGPDTDRINSYLRRKAEDKIEHKKREIKSRLDTEKEKKRVELEKRREDKRLELERKAQEKLDKLIGGEAKKKLKDLFK